MVERILVPLVLVMIAAAAIYAFANHPSLGVTGASVSNQISCTDTDNGDPYTAGVTISEIYPDGRAQDTCVGNDLLEYYCSGGEPEIRAVSCSNSCVAGACRN